MLAFTRAMGDSLSPLRIRPLRLYLGGQAISVVGTFMQATAQSWVVWKLSHSPAMLGFVALLSTLSFLLLGPLAGVWADRPGAADYRRGHDAAPVHPGSGCLASG
jgi:MFS family permease